MAGSSRRSTSDRVTDSTTLVLRSRCVPLSFSAFCHSRLWQADPPLRVWTALLNVRCAQSWNKFCFQGGRLEARIRLPGSPTVMGLWPAFWTLGNLGRVGYGGTLEGTWPYSYDSCDVGTLANQTLNGLPAVNAKTGLAAASDYALSYLPGQRLSACTCPDDATHPGPKRSDGTFVGRSAPEIDVIEAQVANGEGEVSLSAQWAPFNPYYECVCAQHLPLSPSGTRRLKDNG